MGVHDGHRSRMKERFRGHGLENFNDINALELLLFYAAPRRDTNGMAHALLERFGSFSAVLEANEQELLAVPGIGENAVTLLRLIPEVSRRYLLDKTPSNEPIDSAEAAGHYFIPRFMYETEETVYALLLDARKRPIRCAVISRGTVDAAEVNARRLAELALQYRASAVILAHNHRSGVALPSVEDETSTARLARALVRPADDPAGARRARDDGHPSHRPHHRRRKRLRLHARGRIYAINHTDLTSDLIPAGLRPPPVLQCRAFFPAYRAGRFVMETG